jgi:uncharacterized protein (TIGR01777 family)
MGKKVIIAGGSGMIGRALTAHLLKLDYEVEWLSHSGRTGPVPVHAWQPARGDLPAEVIRSADVIINLAGAGIADQRWTASRKEILRTSRIDGNVALAELLKVDSGRVQTYISSAAMGIYGDRGDRWCAEDDSVEGEDFLTHICVDWESAIQKVQAVGVRTVWFRISVVLSMEGGALPKIAGPMRYGLASYFGRGSQYYSWIHIDDLVRAFVHAMESGDMHGAYNVATQAPLPMKDWVRKLADSYPSSPMIVPVPAFGLRLAFGEMADVLLNSVRLDVNKLEETGFCWRFSNLLDAGQNLFFSE